MTAISVILWSWADCLLTVAVSKANSAITQLVKLSKMSVNIQYTVDNTCTCFLVKTLGLAEQPVSSTLRSISHKNVYFGSELDNGAEHIIGLNGW